VLRWCDRTDCIRQFSSAAPGLKKTWGQHAIQTLPIQSTGACTCIAAPAQCSNSFGIHRKWPRLTTALVGNACKMLTILWSFFPGCNVLCGDSLLTTCWTCTVECCLEIQRPGMLSNTARYSRWTSLVDVTGPHRLSK